MSILESPEKQLKKLVYKDYIRRTVGINSNQEVAKQMFKMQEKELTKEYLKKHPKTAKKCESIKQLRKRLTIAGTVATLAIGGGGIYTLAGHKEMPKQNEKMIEQEENSYLQNIEEVTVSQEDFETFYEEIDKENREDVRNEKIRDFAEKVVVAGYNKQNPEETIGEEDFCWTAVKGEIGIRRDKLGNITSYQLGAKEQNKQETMQKQYYEFKINGYVVARYDAEGVEIKSDIENDTYFQKVIPLVKEAENLQKEYASQYAGEQDRENKREAFEKAAGSIIEMEEQSMEQEIQRG